MHGYTFFISPSPLPPAKLLRDSAIITWREGDWEMCEIRPKTKSYSPLIKQKLISTPPAPSHNDNIKFNPPLEKSLLPLIPSYLVYLLDFFLRYKHHFKWLFDVCWRVIWRVIRITGLWACVVFAWIGKFLIFYNASLALRFPRAWVAWELDQSTQPCFHLS